VIDGRHQAKALPTHTGTPIVFAGSTTGPKYTAKKMLALSSHLERSPKLRKVKYRIFA